MLLENYGRYLKRCEYFSAKTLKKITSEHVIAGFRPLISYFFDEMKFPESKFHN